MRKHGQMLSKLTGRYEQGFVVFVARSSGIALAFPWIKSICRPRPTTASSTSGRMSARACAVYEAGFAPVTFGPITREELNAHLVL